MKKCLSVVFLLVSFASLSFGQGTASLTGTVKDQSGAVVPRATITATGIATGTTRTTLSTDSGLYNIPSLSPGEYKVQAELPGFRIIVRSGITLRVGDQISLDLVMQVGEVSEKVEVNAEAPLVETTSSVVGGVVASQTMENLPLNGRGFADLTLLQPNTTFASTNVSTASAGFGIKISVSGLRPSSGLFTLDGQDVNSFFNDLGSVTGSAAGMEAVREFKVITNPFSAEYGRTGSGVVEIVTKSGTNNLHGSAYDFLRNSALDARRWEDNAFSNGRKPAFRRNQFGGSVGGPIVRNKTFFFGNYEGFRSLLGGTRLFNVLDANAHNGLLPDQNGVLQSVNIAPNVKPYLDLFPLPTSPLGNGVGQYSLVANAVTNDNYWLVRGDHALTSSTQLYGRFSHDSGNNRNPNDFLLDTVTQSGTKFVAVGLMSVLSPRWVNSFQLFYNRSISAVNIEPRALLTNPKLLQFTSYPVFGLLTPGAPATPVGYNASVTNIANNVYQVRDDVSVEAGRHSLKLGGNIELFQPNILNAASPAGGSYAFTNLSNFLKGIPSTFTAALPGSRINSSFRQWLVGAYIQDSFRLSPRLTVNAGVRYEPITSPNARFGAAASLHNFASRTATPQDITVGNPLFQNPSLKNFAPRLGVLWSPDGKTAVHLGFGTFFDQLLGTDWRVPATLEPPLFIRGTLNASNSLAIDFPNAVNTQGTLLAGALVNKGIQFNIDQPTTMQYTMEVQRQLGSKRVLSVRYVGTRGWHLIRDVEHNQRVPTVSADGRLFFGPTAPVFNTNFSSLDARHTDANSFYNAFSASFEQRYSAGLIGQVSYTYSKSIDDTSTTVGATDFSNDSGLWRYAFSPPKDGRGLSAFDVRQNLVLNFTYELPWGSSRRRPLKGIANALMGGWSANSLLKLSGGVPFNVSGSLSYSATSTPTFGTLDSGPPDLVAGGKANSIHPQNPDQYFTPTMFVLPTAGFYGNLGRHALIGPGIANMDFSLSKEAVVSAISEGFKIQFRAEFFNLFNRPNFGLPLGTLFDPRTLKYRPDVGRISSTITPSRQIQFVLKVLF